MTSEQEKQAAFERGFTRRITGAVADYIQNKQAAKFMRGGGVTKIRPSAANTMSFSPSPRSMSAAPSTPRPTTVAAPAATPSLATTFVRPKRDFGQGHDFYQGRMKNMVKAMDVGQMTDAERNAMHHAMEVSRKYRMANPDLGSRPSVHAPSIAKSVINPTSVVKPTVAPSLATAASTPGSAPLPTPAPLTAAPLPTPAPLTEFAQRFHPP
jgi:hypothetical protein